MTKRNDKSKSVAASKNEVSMSFEAPIYKEVRGKDWIPYGDSEELGSNRNGSYPNFLDELANHSALHGAILQSKTQQIAGSGVTIEDSDTTEQTRTFLDNVNGKGDSFEDLAPDFAQDKARYNGFAVNVIWSRDWTVPALFDYIEFGNLRASNVNSDGEIPGYYYSPDWDTQRPQVTFIPSYNPVVAARNASSLAAGNEIPVITDISGKVDVIQGNVQVLVVKPRKPFYYPLPQYVGAINAIESDAEADIYSRSVLESGLSSDFAVIYKKSLTNEQFQNEVDAFNDIYTGSRNAGTPIHVNAGKTGDEVDIQQLGGSVEDKRFDNISENTLQKILSGHRVTSPLLVGIRVAGSLGGATELELAQEIFHSTVIRPDQQAIEKGINRLLRRKKLSTISIDRFTILGGQQNDNNIQ